MKKEEKIKEEESFHQLAPSTVKEVHEWKQHGNQLICDSCPSRHGIYIPTNKIMTGVDEKGNPILKNRF